jgi:hypothetical protein
MIKHRLVIMSKSLDVGDGGRRAGGEEVEDEEDKSPVVRV